MHKQHSRPPAHLSHSLFATFLDTKHMMYSSAIFDTRLVPTSSVTVGGASTVSLEFHGSLEDAQTRKIDALLARLEPLDAQHTLLDIGFGWGGVCIRAAEKYGCKVHGITLSVEQKDLAEQLVKEKGSSCDILVHLTFLDTKQTLAKS